MKFQLPERAFPPLVLSPHEERDLIDETERIVAATIAAQEQYIRRGRRVHAGQWKHLRTKEGMVVYRQRSVGAAKRQFDPLTISDDDSHFDTGASPSAWLPVRDTLAASSTPSGGHTPSSMLSNFRATAAAKTPGLRRAPQSTKSVSSLDERLPMHVHSPASSLDNQSTTTSTTSEHAWMEYQRKPTHVPGMLAVGLVDGTLENAMYGVLTEDDASWRWKSSQINDKLDDAKVLATIRGPTRDDPFRFIGVKWFTKEHPSALHSVVKRRDFLTIEAMGTTYDSTGTIRLGYFMMHSVDLPRIPVLSDLGILRGQASFCFILRQASASSIEVFARGFSDPQGDMYEAVSVMLASESLLASIRIVDFGHIKKLRWLMIHRRHHHHRQRQQTQTQIQNSEGAACSMCHKPVKRFGSLFHGRSSCQVCHASVCGKCVIIKHITVDITSAGATQKPLPFCLACVLEAKNLDAWEIARADVTQRQYHLLPDELHAADEDPALLRRVTSAPGMVTTATKARSDSRIRSASHGLTRPPERYPPSHPPSQSPHTEQRRRQTGAVLLYS